MAALARNFWFDSLTHDAGILAALAGRFGPGRVVLGSDAPFDMADDDPLGTLAAAIPDAGDRELIAKAGLALLQPADGL